MTTTAPVWTLALAVVTLACESTARLETRTFQLNHLSPGEASAIIEPYVFTDRAGAPGRLNSAATSITVRETRDNLDRIARVLAEYDRPTPGLRLTFRLIEANGAAASDPAIADVEATLRTLFRFRGYRLVGEAVTAAAERQEITQWLGSPTERHELNVTVHDLRGAGDSATLRLDVRLIDGLRTGLTIPVGKTAVVGSAQPRTGKGTLILTVRSDFVTE
jgi:hypothetical protein